MIVVPWDSKDADGWKAYLDKNQSKIIRKLREFLPKVEGKTFEEAALDGRGKQEAENIIAHLEALSEIDRPQITRPANVDVSGDIPK